MNPAFWSGKRVLLTGHTGFKGSWLSLWLQSLGATRHAGDTSLLYPPAADLAEAVALHKSHDFDCVLMDVQMPEMDGVEATHIIRSLETMRNRERVPIIAVTAYAMNGDRERFLAEGMDDHMGKPVQLENLVQALRRVCPVRSA